MSEIEGWTPIDPEGYECRGCGWNHNVPQEHDCPGGRVVSPAEELHQAAATLRALAAEATPGPWVAWGAFDVRSAALSDRNLAETTVSSDADWIVTMSPAIAYPLAAWLDREADLATMGAHPTMEARVFARSINRSEP